MCVCVRVHVCVCVCTCVLSCVQLFVTPWTVARQAPPAGFSRQEYWGGLPFPSSGDLPAQELNLGLPHCMQTLYCLSHEGISRSFIMFLVYFLSALARI